MANSGPPRKSGRNQYGPHKIIDVNRALDLKYNRHLSYKDIGKIQGVSAQAVHARIRHLLPTPDTQYYQDNRADILSNIQLELLRQLDPTRLKKMPAGSAVLAACQLYDKERLERGQSTANADMRVLSGTLEELKEQEKELMKSLGMDPADSATPKTNDK